MHSDTVREARLVVTVLAALVIAIAPLRALAQDLEEEVEEQAYPQFKVIGQGGFTYQGEADIDGGGSVQVNRYDAAIATQTDLTTELHWTNTLFFGADDYDFDGGGFSAGNPWNTILALRMGTKLRYQLTQDWGIWAGGILMFTPESGADWGRSVTGGGRVGADYQFTKTLFVSAGVAIITQIEDDVKLAPSIGVKWVPHELWVVRVGAVPVSGGVATGAEVQYQVTKPVQLGLGVLFQERRFRLENSGVVAPDGVGQENNLPLRLRVGWNINDNFSLHFMGGVAFAGELQLDNQNGNRLRKENYDPAAFFTVRLLAGI